MRIDTTRLNYEGIQALRFVAALLVVVTHTTFYAHERLDNSFSVWGHGTVGVDIFFVVSGFVMMYSSQKFVGSRIGWQGFGMRRLIRILPMYWIATTVKLAALVLVPAAVLHAALDPQKVVMSYFLLPTRNVDGRVEPLLGVGWTLLFEMFLVAIHLAAVMSGVFCSLWS